MRMLAVVALCTGLAACGSAPSPAPTNESPATPVAAAPSTPTLIEIPRAPTQPRADRERAAGTAKVDFDAIASRGFIRILVSSSRTHFETTAEGHRGTAVDIGVALAKELTARTGSTVVPVFIATPEHDLIPRVLDGTGDVAANLLITFERDDQVAFAPAIKTGIRELVATPSAKPMVSLEDVGGREIHVRPDTDHLASLQRLNGQLKGINRPQAKIVIDRTHKTDEDLLDAVNAGRIPSTLIDDYIFDRWKAQLPSTMVNRDIAVSQDGALSWVSRKDAPRLVVFLKDFFSTHRVAF